MPIKIGTKSQIPPGKSITVELPDGRVIALFNYNGDFFALNNSCPHQGGPLAEGKFEGDHITCPWHDWTFDIKSGKCLNMECERVRTYPVEIKGEDILLQIEKLDV